MRGALIFTLSLGFAGLLTGCQNVGDPHQDSLAVAPALSLKLSQSPTSAIYSAATWLLGPTFALVNASDVTQDSMAGAVTLTPYADDGCLTPAQGTFQVDQAQVSLASGLAAFTGLSYISAGNLDK